MLDGSREPMISMHVVSLAGDGLNLDVETTSTIAHLKRKLAEVDGVPVQCLRLCLGCRVLQDTEVVADSCQAGESHVTLTRIVSLDELVHGLDEANDTDTRVRALQTLGQLARPRGGQLREQALARAGGLVVDDDEEVREAAVGTLGCLACKGDACVISMVRRRLSLETSACVRLALVHVLRTLASCDGWRQDVVDDVVGCLSDGCEDVQMAAVRAMGELADAGWAAALSKVMALFGSTIPSARRVAVLASCRVAQSGGSVEGQGDGDEARDAVKVLLSQVGLLAGDADASVRSAAVEVLGQLGHGGDAAVIGVLCESVADRTACVRRAALSSLASLAIPDDALVVAAVASSLADRVTSVRRAAVRTLAEVAQEGSDAAWQAISPLLEDVRVEVRREAVEATELVAAKGDRRVLQALELRVLDQDAGVRYLATKALRALREDGSS